MARKKKVVITDQELTPTVLATIKTQKSSIISTTINLVFIFIIFCGVAYYLPEITNQVNEYFNPTEILAPITEPKKDDPEEPIDTITKYNYSPALRIDEDKFSISNFNLLNNKLAFRINNTTKTELDMDKYNYYLELYNDKDTLLERIKVDDVKVGVSSSIVKEFDVLSSDIAYLTFQEIKIEEYPAYIAPADEEKNGKLICIKDKETITYSLKNNKLLIINDQLVVNNTDVDYATLLPTYQSLASTYNAITGVTSIVREDVDSFTFTTIVNTSSLNSVDQSFNKMVYPKDTDAKIIRFELMARGYTCD